MTNKTYDHIIIGNSVGGIAGAEAIREKDRKATVAMISDEPYPAYSRPLISHYLAHPYPIESMAYRRPDFYEKNGIDTVFGERVTGIDTKGKTVKLASGSTLTYGSLLIATGGTPIVPPMEGIDLEGVFTFNKLDDAKAIDEFISRHPRKVKAVVIGGGLIGISVTEALTSRGVDVVIVEMQGRILSAMLDAEAAAIEAEALAEAGVNVITGHTATRINSALPGHVSGVTLDDERVIYADMVIAAIGVRPRLDALEGSGIKTNRGILVNQVMQTSAPDVYACGDVAEAWDYVYGTNRLTPIWPNAYDGGRAAGLTMAGTPTDYPGGTGMNAMKYFGKHIVSAGMPDAPDASYEVLTARHDDIYRKVIVKDNKVTGLIFAGDIQKSGIIYNLMKNGTDVSAFKEALVSDGFGLASLPPEIWQERLQRTISKRATIITEPEEPEEVPIID